MTTKYYGDGQVSRELYEFLHAYNYLSIFLLAGVLLWFSRSIWQNSISFDLQKSTLLLWVLILPLLHFPWVMGNLFTLSPDTPVGGGFNGQHTHIVLLFATAVAAPFIEELIFRGVLFQNLLDRNMSPKNVVLATTLVWALVHLPQDLGAVKVFMVFPTGIVLGYLRQKTNSLALPVIAHTTVNLLGQLLPAIPANDLWQQLLTLQ